jgi:hypothetical protein
MTWKITLGILALLLIWASFIADDITKNWRKQASLILDPGRLKFACPNCGGAIAGYLVNIGFGERWTRAAFECPTCRCLLCVTSRYAWLVFGGTLSLAVAIGVLLGVHPWFLLFPAVALIQLLLAMLVGQYLKVIFPPKIIRHYTDDGSLRIGPGQ